MTSPAPAYANESNVAFYYWLDLSANNICVIEFAGLLKTNISQIF